MSRELDLLIAEKVMGEMFLDLSISQFDEQGRINDRGIFPFSVPHYSTDIKAAWDVIEKFKNEGQYKIEISAYPKDEVWTIKAFHVSGTHSKSCTTSAKTLSDAICKAALKAVEKTNE